MARTLPIRTFLSSGTVAVPAALSASALAVLAAAPVVLVIHQIYGLSARGRQPEGRRP